MYNLQLTQNICLRCLNSSIALIYKVKFPYPRPALSAIVSQLLTSVVTKIRIQRCKIDNNPPGED